MGLKISELPDNVGHFTVHRRIIISLHRSVSLYRGTNYFFSPWNKLELNRPADFKNTKKAYSIDNLIEKGYIEVDEI